MEDNKEFINKLNSIVEEYRTTLTSYLNHLQKDENVNLEVEEALIGCVQSLGYFENIRK